MLDRGGEVIYVGKAKNLKRRVSSYFNKQHADLKTTLLTSQIAHIELIVTASDHAALILENQLIKQYFPKYNIALKDDKNYPYIKITTKEPFPKVLVVRERKKDGATYFGPYPSIGSTRRLQRILYELFPLRDCKQKIDLENMQPKCIKLDLGKCLGPCILKDVKSDYDALVQDLILLLSGKNKRLIHKLKEQMQLFSEKQAYEAAAKVRDRLQKIQELNQKQTVDLDSRLDLQIWSKAENKHFFYVLVQTIVEGKLLYQKGFYLDKIFSDQYEHFLINSVIDYLDEQEVLPTELVCEEEMSAVLSRATLHVPIKVPKKGLKRTLLENAEKNAAVSLIRLQDGRKQDVLEIDAETLTEIKTLFELKRIPHRIMGFDISHLQGTNIVGSSVYFKNGKPHKEGYRRFNVKTVRDLSNDPQSMYEVVYRRLRRCLEDKEPLPQLLLIDGGQAQLNFAIKAVSQLGLQSEVELLALAKREEEVYQPRKNATMRLPRRHPALKLFQQIRDEAHRFAVTFQQSRRKHGYKSKLLGLPGLGPVRVNKIYQRFKSLDRIGAHDLDELASIGNIGRDLAKQIIDMIEADR